MSDVVYFFEDRVRRAGAFEQRRMTVAASDIAAIATAERAGQCYQAARETTLYLVKNGAAEVWALTRGQQEDCFFQRAVNEKLLSLSSEKELGCSSDRRKLGLHWALSEGAGKIAEEDWYEFHGDAELEARNFFVRLSALTAFFPEQNKYYLSGFKKPVVFSSNEASSGLWQNPVVSKKFIAAKTPFGKPVLINADALDDLRFLSNSSKAAYFCCPAVKNRADIPYFVRFICQDKREIVIVNPLARTKDNVFKDIVALIKKVKKLRTPQPAARPA